MVPRRRSADRWRYRPLRCRRRVSAARPTREDRGAAAPPLNDLSLELMRQHTLVSVMTARMRETAEGLARGSTPDPRRIERALAVYRAFHLEVHHADEALLARSLARVRAPEVKALLADCAREHPLAEEFERNVRAALRGDLAARGPAALRLAQLFREEADRVEAHHEREDEVYRTLDRYLSAAVRRRLLAQIRRFDGPRIAAEIALIAWASQIHPSAD